MADEIIHESHTAQLPSLRSAGAQTGAIVRRLFQLWRMYALLDLAFLAADLKLGCIYLGADLLTSVASVIGMLLLAERFAGIGPWSQAEVIFLLGYATLVGGIVNTLFGYNVFFISRRIGRGQLDHTLIQPQPVVLSLLTEGFTPFSGSAMLLPGVALLVWGSVGAGIQVSFGWIVMLLINLLASSVVMLAFSFAWGSLAFWAPRAAEEISSSANALTNVLKPFPLNGVGPLLLGTLMSFVPVGFIAWYPSQALLGIDTASWGIWATPMAALLFGLFTLFCFRKGMHFYVRTGSQRYSDFGHRR